MEPYEVIPNMQNQFLGTVEFFMNTTNFTDFINTSNGTGSTSALYRNYTKLLAIHCLIWLGALVICAQVTDMKLGRCFPKPN